MPKIELKVKRHHNLKYFELDGETYVIDGTIAEHGKKDGVGINTLVFKKLDVKEYEKTVDELAEKISKRTKVKEIIKQALFDLQWKQIMAIKKEMKKDSPFIRNNRGCVTISVGKTKIPIRE